MDNHKDILSLGCQLLKLQGFYRPCLTLTLQTVVKDIYLSQNCITCKTNMKERQHQAPGKSSCCNYTTQLLVFCFCFLTL